MRIYRGHAAHAVAACKVTEPVYRADENRTKDCCSSNPSSTENSPINFSNLLGQFPVAVVMADVEGSITYCNPAAEQMYGYKFQELIGRPLTILQLSPDETTLNVVRKAGFFKGKVRHQNRHREAIDLFVSMNLLHDEQVGSRGILQISINVDEQSTEQESVANEHAGTEIPQRRSGSRPMVVERSVNGTPFIIASKFMHKFMGLVDRVASHSETVLLLGETGTGKELVARTIHQSSFRAEEPFVEINCAALPEHLVESELFGYEKGAFSGADTAKAGLFELADKGTLFLDEIGELPLHIQVKLLRVLDGSSYYRLGGHKQVKVDVRVVAATNQDLETAVKEGRFRRDLFHRLSQFHLRVPPLRDRPEDVAVLARHFLSAKAPDKRFSEDAVGFLQSHAWPGNVRELRNVITKLAVDSPANEISADQVRGEISHESVTQGEVVNNTVAIPGDLGSMEEQMIVRALERTRGHRAMAAEQLGISRRTLSRKLREYQINPPGRERNLSLGAISWDQQKSYRAKVQFPARLRTPQGEEFMVAAVNLSSRGMGIEGVTRSAQLEGVLEVSFDLPGEDLQITAKARIMWAEAQGRAGVKFVSMEAETLARLQHWANRKMVEEGWELAQ